MDRLEQIKASVAMEYGHETFEDLLWSMADGEGSDGLKWFEKVLAEVARRYATEVARHNLERAANEAEVLYRGHSFGDYVVNKESITSLEIELI